MGYKSPSYKPERWCHNFWATLYDALFLLEHGMLMFQFQANHLHCFWFSQFTPEMGNKTAVHTLRLRLQILLLKISMLQNHSCAKTHTAGKFSSSVIRLFLSENCRMPYNTYSNWLSHQCRVVESKKCPFPDCSFVYTSELSVSMPSAMV